MEYYQFPSQDDLQLMSLSKKPIYVDGVPIHPITLNQISSIQYSVYIKALNILCLDSDDISSLLDEPLQDEKQVYDFLVYSATTDNDLKDTMLEMLSAICRSRVEIDSGTGDLVSDGFRINRDNFVLVQNAIRFRNCIEKLEDDVENPANDKARELLQKRKMLRKKVQQSKTGEPSLSIGDLVSILSAGLGLPLDVVMEYDMYQFNDQFNRLKIFKDFEVNVQALIHGAESKDVKLKYWISKISRKDDDE